MILHAKNPKILQGWRPRTLLDWCASCTSQLSEFVSVLMSEKTVLEGKLPTSFFTESKNIIPYQNYCIYEIWPLHTSSCDFGRAADLIYTCQVRCHGFDSRCFPHI